MMLQPNNLQRHIEFCTERDWTKDENVKKKSLVELSVESSPKNSRVSSIYSVTMYSTSN